MSSHVAPDSPARKPSMSERRAMRWQRRIERYEARRSGPPPPRHMHRAIVTVLMMLMLLALLALLMAGPADPRL